MRKSDSCWDLKHIYKASDVPMVFSSLAFSPNNRILAAGTTTGTVRLFERRKDGAWGHVAAFPGTSWEAIYHSEMDLTITDMEFVPVHRKTEVLITAITEEICVWFVSSRPGLVAPPGFSPKGLEFPTISRSGERIIEANEATLIQPPSGGNFHAVKASPDGMTFGYTLDSSLVLKRIDRIEPSLTVYESDELLTRLDFDPRESEIVIVGDTEGKADLIDMRVQPTTDKPNRQWDAGSLLGSKFKYVSDLKISPDGSKFFTRHYSDLLFWDMRSNRKPVKRVEIIHESEDSSRLLSADGKDIFRTVWLDNNSVATGSFWGTLYTINTDGKMIPRYVTETSQKEKGRWNWLAFKEKKQKFAKEHCVHVIERSRDGTMIAATNSADVCVYNIRK